MCAAAYDSDVGGLSFTLQANDRTTAPGAFLQLRLACVALDVEFEFIVRCIEIDVDSEARAEGELRRGVFQFVDTHPATIETIRSLVTLYMLGLDRKSRTPGIASGA